jgi:hypothetical protein
MSTVKRVSGNYTLQSINPTDQINFNSSQVNINGNLVVTGNSSIIESTSVNVFNANLTLNSGISPSSPANPVGSYITVDRGTTGAPFSNVAIRWHEANPGIGIQNFGAWQLTNDGVTWANIATSATVGIANVYADPSPRISANLNITGQQIFDQSANVQFYSSSAGSGGSGIYVTNTNTSNAELVTKSKAVAYSIVFG